MPVFDPLVEIVALLTRKAAEMQSTAERSGGFSDLSLRQIYYLDTIARLDNPSPTELAQALGVSKPSVTSAVEKLARLGYVGKVSSDEDRRSYHLHLTEKAQGFIQAHDRMHQELAQALTAGLDEAEVVQLQRLLQKVVERLKE